MKKVLLLPVLLLLMGFTINPDKSILLTKEEAASMKANISTMTEVIVKQRILIERLKNIKSTKCM